MDDWIRAAISDILLIASWYVLYRQSTILKRREEVRALISEITDLIDEIYNLAILYYDDDSSSHINHRSAEIKSKFVLLSRFLITIRSIDQHNNISAALNEFKMHATGGYFETTDFAKQNNIPGWKTNLAASAQEIKFIVEQGYYNKVGAFDKNNSLKL